jgi:uncharacterized damage-inducible protein DinB
MHGAPARPLLAVVASLSALALAPAGVAAQQRPTDPSLAALQASWRQAADYIAQAADDMPEADYAYRPVETVRTFGQMIGHVAGAQNSICAAVLGDPQPAEDAVEKAATTKAALVQALRASTAYCARAYAIGAATLGRPIQLFGQRYTRAGALALNAVHDGEHYGNIVTYLRMKGMVPPSSRR